MGLLEVRILAEFGRGDLVTVRRAATIVGRSDRTIRRLINEQKLRAIRLGSGGGQLYVEVPSLKEYIESGNGNHE